MTICQTVATDTDSAVAGGLKAGEGRVTPFYCSVIFKRLFIHRATFFSIIFYGREASAHCANDLKLTRRSERTKIVLEHEIVPERKIVQKKGLCSGAAPSGVVRAPSLSQYCLKIVLNEKTMRLAVAAHTMSDQTTVRKEMVERRVVRREP